MGGRAPHIPKEGTKLHALLKHLLAGERVDPFWALMELNLPTVHARASELRRLGWPVRSIELPHPKLKDEVIVAYVLDAHFRRWMTTNPGKHPADYPHADGRGKFAAFKPEDYER